MSDALRVIDDQSELLMRAITDKQHAENQKRNVCKQQLLTALLERSVTASPPIAPIVELIQREMNHLSHGKVIHIIEKLADYSKDHKVNHHFCRALGLLAALRRDDELDSLALNYADRFLAESPPTAKAVPMNFRGLLLYCFDRIPDAIAQTREAIVAADAEGQPKLRFVTRQNLAYYIADGENAQSKEEGSRTLEEAKAILDQDQDLMAEKKMKVLMSTLGYFKITFGKDLNEVEDGWKLCRDATDGHPMGPVGAKAYLAIHQARALLRMLDFT